ncbi:MAG: glycosyltransferase family 4 protein [Methylibium sp.]|uniref:glycosyltransferase family 4 protein n=1 Tax=Methylibium sp. TaxID=2067992 RepID=UPI00184EB4D0|nr:glycosyltransferase family 4 protein [Methylibium sp.]MBA3598429.1 glycosyltransferase family 4 protein [Methylibium sp.]
MTEETGAGRRLQRHCSFVLPGDWHTATGGYAYDRRIAEGLQGLGWTVEPCLLDESFPQPTDDALLQAEAALAALADGALVMADGLAFGAMPALAERHARRLRWVALVHHPLAFETGIEESRRRALLESERRSLATAHAVIATSAATARALAQFDVPAARVHVVEPGTDPAPLARGSGKAATTLLCVATLTPRKGHAVLIEALAGLKDRRWTLVCAGSTTRDPATTAALRGAIADAGLGERVQLLGEVDPARLAALYDSADLFVLPSHYEGYGMVLAEALARGLPVLATTAGAMADTVPPDAGVLVPPGDAAALRSALAGLLDRPARRLELAAGARAARERLPTWPDACEHFAAVLSTLTPDA